ncbi:sigma factor-like helix-turn-helix DNA-binding protein, partial [Staphylococcus pseudintermedius]|nr:sigma factor-like helix-turn-helix DNA-binding protein [Staphylococcus pseudintermedius]
MENLSVSYLNLSTRAKNLLFKKKINTIKDLIDVKDEDLYSYGKTGEKTADEVLDFKKNINDIRKNNLYISKMLFDEKFHYAFEGSEILSLDEFKKIEQAFNNSILNSELSNRSKNQLVKNGVYTYDILKTLTNNEIASFKNLGLKSLNEIKNFKNKLAISKEDTSLLNDYYVEDIINKEVDEVFGDKRLVSLLRDNNIKTVNVFLQLNYEDVHNLRKVTTDDATIIFNKIINLKKNLKLNYINLVDLIFEKSGNSIREIISSCTPRIKNKIEIKFIFGNRLCDEIKINNFNFSDKEKNLIKEYELNNINELLKYSLNELTKVKGVSKKTVSNVLEKLGKFIVVYSNKNFYLGNISYIYFKKSEYRFLLSLKEPRLTELEQKYIAILDKYLDKNHYSLNYLIDYCLFNEMILKEFREIVLSQGMKDEIVYSYLKTNGEFYLKELKQNISILFADINIEKTLENLINNNLVEESNQKSIRYKEISFLKFVENHYDKTVYLIVSKRLEGATLQEIGQKVNLTRERVRQIIRKVFRYKDDFFLEDKNAYWYSNYSISQNEYQLMFDDNSFSYLNEKYNAGKEHISEIINDELATKELKRKVQSILNKDKIVLGKKVVKKDIISIIRYLMEEYVNVPTHIDDIYDIAKMFINDYQLGNELIIDKRYLTNKLEDKFDAISSGKKIYRSYTFSNYDWDYFYREINLNSWNNKEISSLILFNENTNLMQEFNIFNEYELHNVLRKTYSEFANLQIKLKRMPTLVIGQANRESQVRELAQKHAPIDIDDYIKLYNQTYGIKVSTIQANYLSYIEEYIHDNMIIINSDNLNTVDLIDAKRKFKDKEFLFIEDYENNLETGTIPQVLRKLGFKIFVSYAIKNKYKNANDYYDETFFNNRDILDLNAIDERFEHLSSFKAWLYSKIMNLELLEFQNKKYITINKLKNIGLSKKHLEDYRIKALDKLADGKVWLIETLIDSIGDGDIDLLGFSSIFYRSILRGEKKINIKRISNNYLLSYHKEISILRLIEEELSIEKVIDIYDLLDIIVKKYDINLEKHKIINSIRNSDIY